MIRFENVTKQYKSQTVISDLSLDIEVNEITVLIGPSGCGKTTLLRMVNRLLKPSSGNIYING